LQALLFEGGVDSVSGRPQSLFSNRLVLTNQSFVVDPEKLDKITVSRSFRGRDLRLAVLHLADLRKAEPPRAPSPSHPIPQLDGQQDHVCALWLAWGAACMRFIRTSTRRPMPPASGGRAKVTRRPAVLFFGRNRFDLDAP
jgi:hypothetical protein